MMRRRINLSFKNINQPNCPYNEVYIGNGECDQYMKKQVCNYDGNDCNNEYGEYEYEEYEEYYEHYELN